MAKEDFECFSGNDCDLQYWYECKKCGCVIIVDNSDEMCLDDEIWNCPGCNELANFITNKDYPFTYFTKRDIDAAEDLQKLIAIYKKAGFP